MPLFDTEPKPVCRHKIKYMGVHGLTCRDCGDVVSDDVYSDFELERIMSLPDPRNER
jgi:hypothetical protein